MHLYVFCPFLLLYYSTVILLLLNGIILKKVNSGKDLIDLPLPDLESGLGATAAGLSEEEATRRLEEYGYNEVAREKPISSWRRLWIKTPRRMARA